MKRERCSKCGKACEYTLSFGTPGRPPTTELCETCWDAAMEKLVRTIKERK